MRNQIINRLRVTFEGRRIVAYTHVGSMEEAETIAAYSSQTCEISEICDKTMNDEGLYFSVRWYSTDAIDLLLLSWLMLYRQYRCGASPL